MERKTVDKCLEGELYSTQSECRPPSIKPGPTMQQLINSQSVITLVTTHWMQHLYSDID